MNFNKKNVNTTFLQRNFRENSCANRGHCSAILVAKTDSRASGPDARPQPNWVSARRARRLVAARVII